MTWLLTASGSEIDLRYMASFDVRIEDVAHSLSYLNRFTGHTERPYSVAEHSVLVCDLMRTHYKVTDPSHLLAGLLHDAHESLTGDLSAPMKQLIGSAWNEEEDRIQRAVLKRFGVWTAFTAGWQTIKDADLLALSCERISLMPMSQLPWRVLQTHPPVAVLSKGETPPHVARDRFLNRYRDLVNQRAARAAAIPSTTPPAQA